MSSKQPMSSDQPVALGQDDPSGNSRAAHLFQHVEHIAYMLLGILLACAAAVSLLRAAISLVEGLRQFGSGSAIVDVIDELLFVFMLIEILHTVRASLKTGGLSCEPFLVVGLIASIRRVLVITLETSQTTHDKGWTPDTIRMMHNSLAELGVMAGLIGVMVIGIYMLHRARPHDAEPAGTST